LLSMPTSNPALLLAQQKPFCRGLLPLTCSVSFREGIQLMSRLTAYSRLAPLRTFGSWIFTKAEILRTCTPLFHLKTIIKLLRLK
jgi:hypothetical protein